MDFHESLNMKEALLTRRYRVKSLEDGKITTVVSSRIINMRKPHLGMIKYSICPENWEGTMEVISELSASVENSGVGRYRGLCGKHIAVSKIGTFDIDTNQHKGLYLLLRTLDSHVEVAMASRINFFSNFCGSSAQTASFSVLKNEEEKRIAHLLSFELKQGKSVVLEKIVAIYTSRDRGIYSPLESAQLNIIRNTQKRFVHLGHLHALQWEDLWERFDISIQMAKRNAFNQYETNSGGTEEEEFESHKVDFLSETRFEESSEFIDRVLHLQSVQVLEHSTFLNYVEKFHHNKDYTQVIHDYLQHILRFHTYHLLSVSSSVG